MHYRKRILSHLINQIDRAGNASQLASSINVLDAIYWLSEATQAIPKSCVVNCFKKAGIGPGVATANESQIECLLDEVTNSVTDFEGNEVTASDYVAIDDGVHTENDDEFAEQPSDNDEIDEQNVEADGSFEGLLTQILIIT